MKHVFIGLYRHCLQCGQALKWPEPMTIATKASHLQGYHGPLTIHWCGKWNRLAEIQQIKALVRQLKAFGDITELKH